MSRQDDHLSAPSRRRFLAAASAAGIVGVAGCSSGGNDDSGADGDGNGGGDTDAPADGTDQNGDGGGGDATDMPPETTAAGGGTDAAPAGADVVGGPDDLRERVDVRATVLPNDQGAGRYVYTPAVAWVEQGGTVVWSFEEAEHTVTAYHPQYDRSNRIPSDVETPFNSEFSGVGAPGTSFNFVFDVPGVYNYFCKPHEGSGMVGLVIVDSPQGGPGGKPPDGVESSVAAEHITRLLELAGIQG